MTRAADQAPGRAPWAIALRHAAATLLETRAGLIAPRRRRAVVARHLREALEQAGPGFVKAGQLLSVRPDLVPPAWTEELERLQDAGPQVPFDAVRSVLHQALGPERTWPFVDLEEHPVAAASVAQVHRARLRWDYRPVVGSPIPAGATVAVKVLRPGIEARLQADLAWARRWARRTRALPGVPSGALEGVLDDIEASAAREVDLRNEGRVAGGFAHDFADDPLIVVPRVVWPGTTRRVLTTEWIEGWRLRDLGPVERAGIDARALAEHGARAFLRQVLVLGRFHADLHPANLLVTTDGRICYLDFGIMGEASPEQRRAIARLLAATAFGDEALALRASRDLGLDIPDAEAAAVAREVAALAERHLRHRTPADVRGYATGFLELLRRRKIAIPNGYGLLVKALLTVEGVARSLYPDLDVVEVARPVVTRLMLADASDPATVSERAERAVRAGLRELIA